MTDHLETLRDHNEWRRGAEIPMTEPAALGEAIDATIAEVERLRAAIIQTLNENGHLADGDNCTLIALKRAMPDWELPE